MQRGFYLYIMIDIELAIMRMGLVSRTQNIPVVLDGTPEQKLGGQLETDVGLIYGFNLYADTVAPDGAILITTTDATNLYLSVAKGADTTVFPLRLDDLLNNIAGSPLIRANKYLPLIVPYTQFSLDKSFISNPTLIGLGLTPGPTVFLNFYYLNMDDYQELINRGPDYGIATPDTMKPIVHGVALDTQANAAPPAEVVAAVQALPQVVIPQRSR